MLLSGRGAGTVLTMVLSVGVLGLSVSSPPPVSAAPPTVVACTLAQYEQALLDNGQHPEAYNQVDADLLSVVTQMVAVHRCNSFSGGITPTWSAFQTVLVPGEAGDEGMMVLDDLGANPTVGENYNLVVSLTGSRRTVNVPGMSPPPDFPPPPLGGSWSDAQPFTVTMRPGGTVYAGNRTGLYTRDPSNNALYSVASASTSAGCWRSDPLTATEDRCTLAIDSWSNDATERLAAAGGEAFVFVAWRWIGASTATPDTCNLVATNLCQLFGPRQYSVLPIKVNYSAAPPSVGITWSAAGSPGAFDFSGNAAAASPATIVRYDWDFHDGDVRPNGSALESKTWIGEATSRTVTLTVTDSNGQTATTTSTLRPRLTITDAPTDPASVNVGDTATMRVTVANDGPSTISNITTAVTIGPSNVATLAFATTPSVASLAPGARATFTVPFNALDDGTAAGTIDAAGVSAGAPITAAQRPFQFVIGNPGIDIEMSGQVVEVGRSFAVLMTITNPGTDTVGNLQWDDPTGIKVESGDNPPTAQPSVTYLRGPDEPLPITLGPGESARRVYLFNAPFLGASVLTASVKGTTATDHTQVKGKRAMTALVLASWSEAARDLIAIEGVEDALGAHAIAVAELDHQVAGQIGSALDWNSMSPSERQAVEQAGLSPDGLGELVNGSLRSGTGQFGAMVNGWTEGFALSMDRFGKENGEKAAALYAAIVDDPEQRRVIATQIWETAKTLPASSWENAGYLGDALSALETVDGLNTIWQANATLASNVTTAVMQAGSGAPTVIAGYANEYLDNPTLAMNHLGKFFGEVSWDGSEAGMKAALGEAGTQAVIRSAAPVVKAGMSVFRSGGTTVADESAIVGSTGVAGADAGEAMVQRMAQAEAVVDGYQMIPANTILDATAVTGKGGVLAEDATSIQTTIGKANTKFGIEFEVRVRTSEPLSAGIDGIAKPEFVKPKAVSVLDQMMGADPSRAGKVGLFKPVPLDDAVVAQLERANPGFAVKYRERLTAQENLWKDWQDPKSKLRVLTEAGEKYKAKGGITVLNDRPNNPVPFGLKYLEQLTEDDFLLSHGIDKADVPAIREQIRVANIDTFKAAPIATEGPNGTVFIDEALSGKPFVSDLDIQSVGPKDGVWPKGVSRGQVETFFKAELSKLKRFPFHGWSDAAVDLPSDFYMAAVPFQIGNANPALAYQAASRVAGRLGLLERLAREKAALLIAAGEPEAAAKLLAPFAKLEKYKDPTTGFYSQELLLKEFPPGEKTINFTAGDIRVGYGTGGI